MDDFLLITLSITAFLSVYWILVGQWKHNKMMKQSRIKAVLFDLDGVIIDSLGAWMKTFNHAREYYKLPKIEKKEFMDSVWGSSIGVSVKNYFKGKTVEEIKKQYYSNMGKFNSHTKLNPNVKETLKKLKNKNLKLGLVTNNLKIPALKTLRHHKIKELFDVVVGGDDVERGKPAPDSLLEACKRLSIQPEEAVFVGDTKSDSGAAKNACMFFIGYNVDGNLKISDFKDLLDLV